jgi:hypothetical protein
LLVVELPAPVGQNLPAPVEHPHAVGEGSTTTSFGRPPPWPRAGGCAGGAWARVKGAGGGILSGGDGAVEEDQEARTGLG